MYPEGSSFGTSLTYLEGVRSITIPASDTVRKQPLVVPEAAEQAYRNHPVWKYFYIIMTHNGVDEIITDKEVAKETWYSLDGKLLGKPEPGKINIRVTTYTDGTTRSHKVAVPQE